MCVLEVGNRSCSFVILILILIATPHFRVLFFYFWLAGNSAWQQGWQKKEGRKAKRIKEELQCSDGGEIAQRGKELQNRRKSSSFLCLAVFLVGAQTGTFCHCKDAEDIQLLFFFLCLLSCSLLLMLHRGLIHINPQNEQHTKLYFCCLLFVWRGESEGILSWLKLANVNSACQKQIVCSAFDLYLKQPHWVLSKKS